MDSCLEPVKLHEGLTGTKSLSRISSMLLSAVMQTMSWELAVMTMSLTRSFMVHCRKAWPSKSHMKIFLQGRIQKIAIAYITPETRYLHLPKSAWCWNLCKNCWWESVNDRQVTRWKYVYHIETCCRCSLTFGSCSSLVTEIKRISLRCILTKKLHARIGVPLTHLTDINLRGNVCSRDSLCWNGNFWKGNGVSVR